MNTNNMKRGGEQVKGDWVRETGCGTGEGKGGEGRLGAVRSVVRFRGRVLGL